MLGPQDDAGVRTEVLTFRAADQRGCGELTAEDIGEALRLQGLEVPADLQQIWSRVDINQCGKVNLIEFVAATMEPRVFCQPALFKAAFRVLGPPPSAPHHCSTAHRGAPMATPGRPPHSRWRNPYRLSPSLHPQAEAAAPQPSPQSPPPNPHPAPHLDPHPEPHPEPSPYSTQMPTATGGSRRLTSRRCSTRCGM